MDNNSFLAITKLGKTNFDWLTVREFHYVSLYQTLCLYPILRFSKFIAITVSTKTVEAFSLYHLNTG
jgi:hypothetical protein